jgi:two-component system response regulator AtoC
VRELENAMERAVILCEGDRISSSHFNLSGPSAVETEERVRSLVDLNGSLSEVASRAASLAEREKIRLVLEDVGWNKTRAAELLQVSYKTLLSKLKELRVQERQS